MDNRCLPVVDYLNYLLRGCAVECGRIETRMRNRCAGRFRKWQSVQK